MTPETTLPSMAISDETRGHLERIAKRRQKLDTEWREAIKRAVAEGGTLREVGEAAGISHTAVKFIVHGRP